MKLLAVILSTTVHAAPIEVAVDPRIELAAALCRLAGFEEYQGGPITPFVAAADAWLAPHVEHPSVLEARRLRQEIGVGFDMPMNLSVHLRPSLRPIWRRDALPERLAGRWTPDGARRFATALERFSEDVRFDALLTEQADYVASVEAHWQAFLEARDVAGWVDAFFNAPAGSDVTLVPGLLVAGGNFGLSVAQRRKVKLLPVIGIPRVDEQGLPTLGRGQEEMAVHELSHAWVNPAFAAQSEVLAEGGGAAWSIAGDRLRRIGYADWQTLVNETGVRAATVLYVRDRHGTQAGAEALATEEAQGFAWMKDAVDVLDPCRADRAACPEIGAVAPALGEVLAAWARDPKYPPFRGNANAAFNADGAAIVLPSGASDLVRYVTKVHGIAFSHLPLLAPDAVEGTRALIAYGSPATNPHVAAALRAAGWRIDEAGLAFDGRTYDGDDLVLVAALPHPADAAVPVVVLTAARDDTLLGVHAFEIGGSGWLVARRHADGRFEVLAEGDRPVPVPADW